MKAQKLWTDRHLQDDKTLPRSVHDVAFSPNGDRVVVAAGEKLLIYDVEKGEHLQTKVAHRDNIYSVSYSKDGRFFASGSADKQVIMWDAQTFEGAIRYAHNENVQSVSFNPHSGHLASCSNTDFGIYVLETRGINKHKATGRILTCGWTNDGQYLALGYWNGTISIRNKLGEEKVKINRSNNNPVWALTWHPSRDQIAAADWGQRLAFFALNGSTGGRDRNLGYDPCFITYICGGDYLLLGGTNKEVVLYSKEGFKLTSVCEQLSWVWCCKQRPNTPAGVVHLIVGCQDGTVTCYSLQFTTVHSLYRDKYAFRENMTDVIIQHLPTDQKTRVKLRNLVKRISVYRNKLAIQTPDYVNIYERKPDAPDLQYRLQVTVDLALDCNLLVVCTKSLVLCQEMRLQSFSFTGVKRREWAVSSFIRYIKVLGGPPGAEGLLCGLRSGEVVKLFLDNAFVIPVLQLKHPIRCLDINESHSKVAVVDENNLLQVYELSKKELLFQEPNATSLSWNTENEDMLCYSGSGTLAIKTANFPPHQQKLNGYVVGFSGSKVFCLQGQVITSIDVPQSASVMKFLGQKNYRDAYKVACLGVTLQDWNVLATEALEGLDFDISRKAFTRTRDSKYLELIACIDEKEKRGEMNKDLFLAEVYAYQSRFPDAAKLFEKNNEFDKAIDMYTELRMFDKAKECIKRSNTKTSANRVQRQEAEWLKTINDPRAACDMYQSVQEFGKAIEIMAAQNWTEQLLQLIRQLSASENKNELRQAAKLMDEQLDHWEYALEAYRKLDDVASQVRLFSRHDQWDSAFELVQDDSALKEEVYVNYAEFLARSDRFVEAQNAYHKAGRDDKALETLAKLTDNAINECRFSDAAYYNFLLSEQYAENAQLFPENEEKFVKLFWKCRRNAEYYYVFHHVYSFMIQPASKIAQRVLFDMTRYIALDTENLPQGVTRPYVYMALAKLSRQLGAYRLSRFCYEKLQKLVIPKHHVKTLARESMTIRAKEVSDDPSILPACSRCSTENALVHNHGRVCNNCRQPYVWDFVTFEFLPVVEFMLEDDISDEEAMELILLAPRNVTKEAEVDEATPNRLRLADQLEDEGRQEADAFTAKLQDFDNHASASKPIVVDREILMSFDSRDVIVQPWPAPLRYQYYKSLVHKHDITVCKRCLTMFNMDEYRQLCLELEHCPFCREPVDIDKPIVRHQWRPQQEN